MKRKIRVMSLMPILNITQEARRIRTINPKKKPKMAHISCREISCDRCGYVGKEKDFHSFYFGDKGQKVDLCKKCFQREMMKNG